MKKINTVCIVEDDPVHLFVTNRFLTKSGLVEKVMVCSNGKDAFEQLNGMHLNEELLPELILLDLNMPVWDGWQFLDAFVKIPLKQKVVIYILTSSEASEDVRRAEFYNLKNNYIVKPITLPQLETIIRPLLS